MNAVIEQLRHGAVIVFTLHVSTMIFIDRVQLQNRRRCLIGDSVGTPIYWRGPASERSFYLLWSSWILLDVVGLAAPRSIVSSRVPAPYWQWFALGAWAILVLWIVTVDFRFRRRMRFLKDFQVSRGRLVDAVDGLALRTGAFALGTPPLFIIPDRDFEKGCARLGVGAALPLELLDMLSRQEVKALIARQLCQQAGSFYYAAFWALFVVDASGVVAVRMLQFGTLASGAAFILLAAAEFLLLGRFLPQMLMNADIQSIRLTGDPEAFFSGVGGLSRHTGAPIQEASLMEVARRSEIPPERLTTLLAERVSPAEDRFPTSGPYLETGL